MIIINSNNSFTMDSIAAITNQSKVMGIMEEVRILLEIRPQESPSMLRGMKK